MREPGVFRRAFDAVEAPVAMRRFVIDRLSDPARRWHGLLHHALMLRAILRSPHAGQDRRRLVLAVLFHDIVYDGTRTDNEEASAQVARGWLDGAEAEAVATLILATRHHDLDTDPVTRTLLEADLAVLWTPSAALYRFYADGIRREYAHVADHAYRTGRAAVLDRLQAQLLPHLDAIRRERLVANLAGEHTQLQAGSGDPPEPQASTTSSASA